MNDGQFFSAYSVIDKKWIASGREHANAGNISFPPEPWITREQNRICRTTAVAARLLR